MMASQECTVIDLSEVRRRRRAKAGLAANRMGQPAPLVWYPVVMMLPVPMWVWVMPQQG